MSAIQCQWWGEVPYADAVARQETLRDRVLDGEEPGFLVFVEHPAVITAGRHMPTTPEQKEFFAHHGVDLQPSSRGGKLTYHGPGQLVIYPIVHLPSLRLGVRDCVAALSGGLMDWLKGYGVESEWREDAPGVWIEGAESKKLASVGLRITRGVTLHGAAINLSTQMSHFELFEPCGFQGSIMTNLERVLGKSVPLLEAANELAPCIAARFGASLSPMELLPTPSSFGQPAESAG